ncbi:MAG: hypothetical protein HC895_19095 [Leptolyngbyaceae cyanobacterium SM1_3_5]|nr:hypothetical protein [Leptolyngbyaceae cyanobacterium SM1_3_5]
MPDSPLRRYANAQLRRVLTQMDRDPNSPTFGCFDRNYWHYKIRDFPSSILQQGVSALDAIRRGDLLADVQPETIESWCIAAVNALARQVDRSGGVDEYYPLERSYPAAAFGLYAAGRVLTQWPSHLQEVIDWQPLKRLAEHLADRVESKAMNQQAAGLAGLALAAKLSLISPERVKPHADRLFAAQHPEGWFDEYGGPDFGYLAVTLDALTDYYDVTQDDRALEAIDRAVNFLSRLVGADGKLPSTLNCRNTDYVVPYGLVRAASRNPIASWLVETLFANPDEPDHFLWATDDRYHCHYIYASVVRSLPYLEKCCRRKLLLWNRKSGWKAAATGLFGILLELGRLTLRRKKADWCGFIGRKGRSLITAGGFTPAKLHGRATGGQTSGALSNPPTASASPARVKHLNFTFPPRSSMAYCEFWRNCWAIAHSPVETANDFSDRQSARRPVRSHRPNFPEWR